jgi:hypothetical protein
MPWISSSSVSSEKIVCQSPISFSLSPISFLVLSTEKSEMSLSITLFFRWLFLLFEMNLTKTCLGNFSKLVCQLPLSQNHRLLWFCLYFANWALKVSVKYRFRCVRYDIVSVNKLIEYLRLLMTWLLWAHRCLIFYRSFVSVLEYNVLEVFSPFKIRASSGLYGLSC